MPDLGLPPPADNSIATKVQVPNGLNTLGSLVSAVGGIQSARGQQIQNESNAQLLQGQNNIRALLQNGGLEQFYDQNGNFDLNKAMPAFTQADPINGAATAAKYADAVTAGNTAKSSLLTLNQHQLAAVGAVVGAHDSDDAPTLINTLQQFKKAMPSAGPAWDLGIQAVTQNANNPAGMKAAMDRFQMTTASLAEQQAAKTPSGVQVDNGQTSQVINTNPYAPPGVGNPIPGTSVQKQLPPTTPTFDSKTQTPGYLGPTSSLVSPPSGQGGFAGNVQNTLAQINSIKDPATRAQALNQFVGQISTLGTKPNAPVQSGPALGQSANVEGAIQTVNNDWQDTAGKAADASTKIGILQNIKSLAPGAVTGVEADRRSYLAGLASLLGMDSGTLAKTKTDELAKSTAMIALAGGNTDLARTLAESATPNTHMTPEAIKFAANQIIGQQKSYIAKQQFLQPFKNLPDQGQSYTTALTHWNQNADPRIFQFADMSPQERQSFAKSMSPQDWQVFKGKIRGLENLGVPLQ